MRGATQVCIRFLRSMSISTHTPHAGRDIVLPQDFQCLINFYSHAPCGARLIIVVLSAYLSIFLLTRPMRGATVELDTDNSDMLISTHTPHAGRDSGKRHLGRADFGFLLTRPMRGATWSMAKL